MKFKLQRMHSTIPVELKKTVLLTFALVLLSTAVAVGFVRPVEASGTIYIRAGGSVEGTTHISSVDNITYTLTANIYDEIVVERDNIVVDGAGYTLQGNESGKGFYLYGISNVTIKNTRIRTFYCGIGLEYSSNNTICGNRITNSYYGVSLLISSNNKIFGNSIENDTFGIKLDLSSSNNFSGNNLTKNEGSGIYLYSSSGNNISENTITNNNEHGVRLWSSSNNNTVSGNHIANNRHSGIVTYDLFSCSVSGNNVTKNDSGIWLESSSNCSISGNNVTKHQINGIRLVDSFHCSISNNNVTNNYIYGIRLTDSSNNRIFHNNFIENTVQAISSSGYVNTWDDGVGEGNYWSDYEERYPNAAAIDGSGIWNTPYVIDVDNQDNYPLMDEGGKFKPYVSTFHVLFEDGLHNLLGNLSAELRITEPEKEIIRSVCKLSLSSPRPDEYHKPYIDKVELFTAWMFIIHPWGPGDILMPPPYPQDVTLHVDEEIILFEHSDNVSGFVEEPRIVSWFYETKFEHPDWGPIIVPTIRVYFSDGQEWEWEYEDNGTLPLQLWPEMDVNLSELSGKIETASITFTTVEKVSPPIIDLLIYLYIILASIIVTIAVAVVFVKYRKKQ